MANSRSLNVNITGDVDRSFTRAMAKADNDVSKLSVRFGSLSGSIGEMAPALARAAPALAAVAVAGTSVASSLAAAAGGAAALGAGMAASLAPMLVVGKQVTSRFEEIKKAYEAVQTAQREGTAESKKNADAALAQLSKNERAMVGSLGRISEVQKKVLGGASDRVFGGLSKAIDMLAPKLLGLAKPFDRLGGAIGDNIERVGRLLSSGPWQSAFKKFVDSATSLVRPITTVFVSIGNIIRDVAVAALPKVQEAVKGVARWFSDLDEKATRSKIREIVGDLVKHTESWFNLFKEIGRLAGTIFGATADSGRGMVDMMTDGVKALNGFVGQMRSGTGPGGQFASVLGGIKDVAVVLWPLLRDAGGASLELLRVGFERAKKIIEVSTPTFLKVKDAASVAFGWLQQNVPPIFETVRGAVSSVVSWLQQHIPPAFNAVKGAVITAFDAIKGAVSSAVQFVRGWINKHRDDINAFGQAWKNIGKAVGVAVGILVLAVKEAIEHVLVPVMKVALDVVKTVWPSIKKIISGVLDAIGGVIQVFSGIFTGDFDRMWDGVKGIFKGGVKIILGIVTGAAKGLLKAATGLGGVIIDGVRDGLSGLGHFLAGKIGDGISWAVHNLPGAALDALKSLGGKVLDAFNPLGDGIGKSLKKAGDGLGSIAGLSGGGSLDGAKQIMAPFVSMAGRFGLHTSSGRRPGAITSSGNVSWHSSGNAVDEAGSPAGMMGYFRYLKANFGSRLRELIYTPGGIGIKDGHPYRYTGQVAADHYDHVHVAFTGDGHGRTPGTGDGIGFRGLENLWVQAHGSTKMAPLMAHIAQAESGGDPRARNPSGASGLWQILGQPFAGNVFDPLTNAKMAVWKYQHQGLGAWAASRGTWGRYVNSGETYTVGGTTSGGSSGGKSKTIDTHTIHSSGGAPAAVDNKVLYPDTRSQAPVLPPFGQGPTKGRIGSGPSKGMSMGQATARQAILDGMPESPSEFDYLDLALANAEATAGTDDDRSALTAIRDYRARALASATATGDPRQIAQARRDLTSAENTLREVVDNTAALAEALKGVQAELKRQTDFATAVETTSNYQLTKTLADLISGHIVGRGVAGRAFTPGTGVEVAY